MEKERKFTPITREHPPNATSTGKKQENLMQRAEKRKRERERANRKLLDEFNTAKG